MAPTGLHGWISSNDGRSTVLFVGFLATIQLIAPLALIVPLVMVDLDHAPFFAWAGYLARYAPIVLVGSMAWFTAQLWWHVETVKRAVGFNFIDANEEPRLCRAIEPLIILAGLPPPYVGVIESDARNAFACGVGRKKAVVVVTRGLLDTLNDGELEAVLAHELSHVKHGDIRLMAAANIFMSTLTLLHAKNRLRFTPIHGLIALAVPALLPLSLAGSLIGRLALQGGRVSRLLIASSREFIADAQAAEWTRNPGALAAALLKVEDRFHIAQARAEDDAMMIAGASEGPGATHPTVAQRVAALARVTGSMVFNAPEAPREGDWTATTTRDAVERTAFSRRAMTTQAITRVRKGDDQNLLGLTFRGTVALSMTIGALLGIHWNKLNDGHAIAATFSLRPVATMIGSPIACELGPFFPAAKTRCEQGKTAGAYRDFEGQNGTLIGMLAHWSRDRRNRGIVDADVSMSTLGDEQVRTTYRGQSGRMAPALVLRDEDGLYVDAAGRVTHAPPTALVVAETERLGCFVRDPRPIENSGPRSIDSGGGARDLVETQNDVDRLNRDTASGTADASTVRYYLAQRETLTDRAYALHGQSGLDALRSKPSSGHEPEALQKLRLAATPAVTATLEPVEVAKLNALLRDPAGFVPCRSLTAHRTVGKW